MSSAAAVNPVGSPPDGAVRSIFRWSDGSSYDGYTLGSERHGFGIYTDYNGHVYEGNWVHDKKEGFFICKFGNGEEFRGHFRDDRRHGRGAHIFPDRSRYDGEYLMDVRHGPGLYSTTHEYNQNVVKTFARIYDRGVLQQEQEVITRQQRLTAKPGSGFGTFVDEVTGERYEGEHEDYMRHGRGLLTEKNGDAFLGTFRADKKHGVGMRRTLDGQYFFQTWADGVLTFTHRSVDAGLLMPVPSSPVGAQNLFWYDEGGFASHN